LLLYKETKLFPREELYGITSQIRRSALSIPANIAEGCGRLTDKENRQFFQVSLGSLHETEYYLLFCKDLNYINDKVYTELNNIIIEIKRMLIKLIKINLNRVEYKA
jgi:four helix bundle protein